MRRFKLLFVSLCCLIIVSACGFTLRSQTTFDFDFDRVKLVGFKDSQMERILKLTLEIHSLEVNTEPAQIKIIRINDTFDRSILTFSATGRAQEVRLSYMLTFEVTDAQGQTQIQQTTLTQRRDITYNDDEILGKEAEENRLFTEMQTDIAQQIVTRIGALPPNNHNKPNTNNKFK